MPQPKKKTVGRVFAMILAYLMLCVGGGAVASGFLIPAAIGANKLAESVLPELQEEPLTLDLATLPQQSRVYASDGTTQLATFYDQNRIIVPLSDVSDYMQKAVVAREDHRFFQHSGIDPQGITRAFVQTYIKKGDTQGGSTLTQQYVKNALIDQALKDNDPIAAYHAQEETIARKVKEMLIAVELEKTYSKAEILQGYLNIAQFGTNTYGVETAARRYFSKSAKDLTLVESATIAAITKNPEGYNPIDHPDEAQKQRNITLDLMAQYGFAPQSEVDSAKATPIADTLHLSEVQVGCSAAGNAAWFCDYVVAVIRNDETFGKTTAEREALLKQGGLDIITTMDVNAENLAYEAVHNAVPEGDPSGMAVAMAVVRPGTGEVLALAQNRQYDAAASVMDDGTKTALNYTVDQQYGGSQGFGPGSSFKPINLVAWMEQGHSMNEVTYPKTSYVTSEFNAASSDCYAGGSDVWNVTNFGGGTASAETPLQALNQSHNTTQAAMAKIIGLCNIANTAEQLGYHLGTSGDNKLIDHIRPSSTIGSDNVAPLTMANVYATIAAKGKRCNPIAIKSITNAAGEKLKVPSADCTQAVPENIANAAAYAMNKNVTQGIASPAQLPDNRKTFAKTGTNEMYSIAFGGFIPQVVGYMMLQHPTNPEANQLYPSLMINGQYSSYGVWDGAYLIPYWKTFMTSYIAAAGLQADNSLGENVDPNLIKSSYSTGTTGTGTGTTTGGTGTTGGATGGTTTGGTGTGTTGGTTGGTGTTGTGTTGGTTSQ